MKFALSKQKWFVSVRNYGNAVYAGAVATGQLSCIALLKSHHFSLEGEMNLPVLAAENGQLKVMRFLHAKGCSVAQCAGVAASASHFACFQYAVDNGATLNTELFICAVRGGNMRIFHTLLHSHCPWDESVCEAAVTGGSLACLQLLHKNGCPWGTNTFTLSVTASRSACYLYLYEHNCPVDPTRALPAAIVANHLPCLTYIHSLGIPFNSWSWLSNKSNVRSFVELAARHENWECAQFLILHGIYMDLHLGEYLFSVGKLDLLRCAVEHECPLSARIGVFYA